MANSAHTHVRTHPRMQPRMHTPTHAHMHTLTHMHTPTHAHTHPHMHTPTHAHTHPRMHPRIAHTHSQPPYPDFSNVFQCSLRQREHEHRGVVPQEGHVTAPDPTVMQSLQPFLYLQRSEQNMQIDTAASWPLSAVGYSSTGLQDP